MIHLFLILFSQNIYSVEIVKVVNLDSIKSMAKECFKDVRPIKRYIIKTNDYVVEGKSKKKLKEEKYFKILNNGEERLIARKIISLDPVEVKELEVCSKYWTK